MKEDKSHRIAWKSEEIIKTVVLAGLGLSNKAVMERTGLSAGQIQYRLQTLGFASIRKDYREGKGTVLAKALAAGTAQARTMAVKQIEKHVGKAEAPTPGTAAPKRR